jgi:DNA-binding LacI/PurR family transcriptional regulator
VIERSAGVRCPQDIALVSFGDLECFEFMNPRVSGVAQATYDLGAYAATLLLKRIGGDSQSPPRRKILKTKLINETKNDASQSTLPLDPDLAEILLTRRATSP